VTDLEAAVEERELTDFNAQLTSIKSQNDNLADQVSSSGLKEKLSNYENLTEQLEEFQDAQLKVVNDKFDKLYTDFVEMTLHLEERFYPYLLTTIARRRWLLTYGMELTIGKCLNSSEYLSALGTAISKAIEKGMQEGLATEITHCKEGQVLTDVAAYNPSAEMDYVFTFQQLQSVNFPLLAELKSNKDVSIEAPMNILRLEEHLAERLGLNESQPHADQLMVPIHHSPNKTVVALIGTEGTFDTAPGTTIALSTTFVSASSIPPISTDDYEVVRLDGQEGACAESQAIADGNADLFANVDDVDLNALQLLACSFVLVVCSRIAASSLLSSERSRLISKASLSYTRSTSTVLSVGMPISAVMTASIPYVNENEVSLLLDFIIVWSAHIT
nr:hypothetical protein [Tanacetum cinerariifolium]